MLTSTYLQLRIYMTAAVEGLPAPAEQIFDLKRMFE